MRSLILSSHSILVHIELMSSCRFRNHDISLICTYTVTLTCPICNMISQGKSAKTFRGHNMFSSLKQLQHVNSIFMDISHFVRVGYSDELFQSRFCQKFTLFWGQRSFRVVLFDIYSKRNIKQGCYFVFLFGLIYANTLHRIFLCFTPPPPPS